MKGANQSRPGSANKVAIIGAGVVGTAVAFLLKQAGYEIVGVASRSQAALDRAYSYLNVRGTTDAAEAATTADIVLITTGDDQIESVCEKVAEQRQFSGGTRVFHFSGALPLGVLAAARAAGAAVGSIHPIQTFADVDAAINLLPGSVFGVTADEDSFPMATEIVSALKGSVIKIRDEDRPLYHVAACIASNYLVTLGWVSLELYSRLGIPPETAVEALMPLMRGTLDNLAAGKGAAALTGPIARGDAQTIQRHLEALKEAWPQILDLYRVMGRYTADVALEKGTLSKSSLAELLVIFGQPPYPE